MLAPAPPAAPRPEPPARAASEGVARAKPLRALQLDAAPVMEVTPAEAEEDGVVELDPAGDAAPHPAAAKPRPAAMERRSSDLNDIQARLGAVRRAGRSRRWLIQIPSTTLGSVLVLSGMGLATAGAAIPAPILEQAGLIGVRLGASTLLAGLLPTSRHWLLGGGVLTAAVVVWYVGLALDAASRMAAQLPCSAACPSHCTAPDIDSTGLCAYALVHELISLARVAVWGAALARLLHALCAGLTANDLVTTYWRVASGGLLAEGCTLLGLSLVAGGVLLAAPRASARADAAGGAFGARLDAALEAVPGGTALLALSAAGMVQAIALGLLLQRPEVRVTLHKWIASHGTAVTTAAGIASLLGAEGEVIELAQKTFRMVTADQVRLADFQPERGGPGAAARRSSLTQRSVQAQIGEVDAFVSHSWHDDPIAKWDALQAWRSAFKARHNGAEPRLWLDKLCIDQSNIEDTLASLPVFLAGCQTLLVLAGETYLARLWCVIELFVFVEMGGQPEQIVPLPVAPGVTAPQGQLSARPSAERAGSSRRRPRKSGLQGSVSAAFALAAASARTAPAGGSGTWRGGGGPAGCGGESPSPNSAASGSLRLSRGSAERGGGGGGGGANGEGGGSSSWAKVKQAGSRASGGGARTRSGGGGGTSGGGSSGARSANRPRALTTSDAGVAAEEAEGRRAALQAAAMERLGIGARAAAASSGLLALPRTADEDSDEGPGEEGQQDSQRAALDAEAHDLVSPFGSEPGSATAGSASGHARSSGQRRVRRSSSQPELRALERSPDGAAANAPPARRVVAFGELPAGGEVDVALSMPAFLERAAAFDVREASCTLSRDRDRLFAIIQAGFKNLDSFNEMVGTALRRAVEVAAERQVAANRFSPARGKGGGFGGLAAVGLPTVLPLSPARAAAAAAATGQRWGSPPTNPSPAAGGPGTPGVRGAPAAAAARGGQRSPKRSALRSPERAAAAQRWAPNGGGGGGVAADADATPAMTVVAVDYEPGAEAGGRRERVGPGGVDDSPHQLRAGAGVRWADD